MIYDGLPFRLFWQTKGLGTGNGNIKGKALEIPWSLGFSNILLTDIMFAKHTCLYFASL